MKKGFTSALTYPKYQRFVNARDQALEVIWRNFRLRQTDILAKTFDAAMGSVAKYIIGKTKTIKNLDHAIEVDFTQAVGRLTDLTNQLKREAYVLSLVGEAEALGRIKGKATYNVNHKLLSALDNKDSMSGGPIGARIELYLTKIRHKIIASVMNAQSRKLDADKTYEMAKQSLPKLNEATQAKALSKMKEAKKAGLLDDEAREEIADKNTIATGFVDQDLWSDIVDDYRTAYIPDTPGIYSTDVEKDMTEDFVKSVRDGQVEAANQNGIDDFVWIAVIDDVTCEECCDWRDGLTSKEIEEQMGDDDECDATTPPAHINCRCRLAPAVETDQEPVTVDNEGFDEWLNG